MPHDPEHMWSRQEKRAELAAVYWDLLKGRPGMRLADVGCGPGYFAWRLAAMTGPTGHLHAVDADPEALAYLRSRLDPVHHAHVTTEVLDVERAPLPDLHYDALLCTDVLHHVDDITAFLRNLRATPARLLVAEFDPSAPGDVGPPIEQRLAPERLERALRAAGWKPGAPVALRHEHYAVVASP